jgi:magnesium chelatase accessory protein
MSPQIALSPDDGSWPNATRQMLEVGGLTWHVQQLGSGPQLLLIHGTGSSSHSWREIAPLLATRFAVTVPDLPGHGFTSTPAFEDFSLPAMARALHALLTALKVSPAIVVGHSAGAAVLVRMSLDGSVCPKIIVAVNGALLPLGGLPGRIFAPLAKVLARSSFVPRALARTVDTKAIERLVADTGSRLDADGIAWYRELAQRPTHVAAALSMMANWDLHSLVRELPQLSVPLTLLSASGDRTIAPEQSLRVRDLLPSAQIISLPGLGHLAHEERPQDVTSILMRLARRTGVLSRDL